MNDDADLDPVVTVPVSGTGTHAAVVTSWGDTGYDGGPDGKAADGLVPDAGGSDRGPGDGATAEGSATATAERPSIRTRKMGAEEVRFRPSFFPYTEPSAEVFVKLGDLGWVEGGSLAFSQRIGIETETKPPSSLSTGQAVGG